MPQLDNDRLLRALRRQPVDATPVWLMRQAGRYLPEYRALRERAGSFTALCQTPELACEATLQPLRRYPLDAAILFSDILTIPDAMGLGLSFAEGEGPRLAHPVRATVDVDRLAVPDPDDTLRYVPDTVRLVKGELGTALPLIGFAGSPWTLATYCVEGATSRDFVVIKGLLYREPNTLHRLLEILTHSVTAYLKAQIDAGVDAVMIFDTWGGQLTPTAYRTFSLGYMARIVTALNTSVPVILFTKGGGPQLEAIADTGCDAVGVDWTLELADARRRIGDRVALQGNLDPGALHGTPERIRDEVAAVLASYGHGTGHVFNLGHGVQPTVDPECVAALVEAVHTLSPPYHQHVPG